MLITDIHVHPPAPGKSPDEFLSTASSMLAAGRRVGITKQVFMGWIDQKSNEQVRE